MSDDKKQELLPPVPRIPPATPLPRPSLPALPTGNSGWLTERGRYERNTAVVAASANYLRARADQAAACAELIGKREELALAIARMHSLPERIAFEYEKTRLSRLSELKLQHLQHQTDETYAEAKLLEARRYLASLQPPPAQTPVLHAPGLMPDEVDELLSNFPDLSVETRSMVVLALQGRLNEKHKGKS